MTRTEYFKEGISDAAAECGLSITDHQLNYLANAVQGGYENIGQISYQPENPMIEENKRLAADLKKEKSKIHCKECNGTGSITTYGPHHSSTSECWKCHGEGRILP